MLFKRAENSRIIIATFASNIYRLKHIVDTCKKTGRKIANSYLFGNAKQFRDANCKQGDILELNASVIESSDNIKIFNFYGLELVK